MKSLRLAHELGKQEAKSRVGAEAARHAQKYGLSSSWDGDTWAGKTTGTTITAKVADEHVNVTVDLAFYIPISEKKVMSRIASEMRKALK